jgi:hypothetical protein
MSTTVSTLGGASPPSPGYGQARRVAGTPTTGCRGTYRLYGRTVRSDVPLCAELGPSEDPPDLDLRLREPSLAALSPEPPRGRLVVGEPGAHFNVAVAEDAAGYTVRVRRLMDVRIGPTLQEAQCHPVPGVGPGHLRDLSTTLMTTWLVLAGSAVFHASAVANVPGLPRGGAVVFAGPSSAGKSTWAALMCSAGADLVSDDALPVGVRAGRPVVEGGYTELRLRPSGRSLSSAFPSCPRRETADGRLALLVGRPLTYPLPVDAVVILEPGGKGRDLQLRQLRARDAIAKLAGSHRLARARLPHAQQAHFDSAVAIAASVPVLAAPAVSSVAPEPAAAELLVDQLRSVVG